jgi:hypothetical protein
MDRNKLWVVLFILMGTFFMTSAGYSAEEQLKKEGNRILNVTVTDIKGDMLFFKTEEGTTRNISLKVVQKYEKVRNVKVGDQLIMEFDEGNQVIRINRPGNSTDRSTVSGQVVKFDSVGNKVTLKLMDGTTHTYTMIPPAGLKMSAVPKGTSVVLDIDEKNNLVKDFERQE